MPHWAQNDPEVAAERALLRAYGVERLWATRQAPRVADGYKSQALRELAHRLELEDAVRDMGKRLARMTDRMEAAECARNIARHEAEGKG